MEINELLVTWSSSGFFFAPTMIVRLLASGAVGGKARANLRTIIYVVDRCIPRICFRHWMFLGRD